MDRVTFEVYTDLLQKWGGHSPDDVAIARTEAAIDLWNLWRAGELPTRGRRLLRERSIPILAIWEERAVSLQTPKQLGALLSSLANVKALRVSISDVDGQPVFGTAQTASVSLTPAETRLPFIMRVSSIEGPHSQARTLFISGFAVALLLMIAAAAALYRVMTRELQLARQQSDFVSAVSHEFRTPLTSMRHLTDLLVSRNVTSEDRKTQYYELLQHETERLHRMVESLLSFGRIEAGGYAWHLEPADVGELVRGIVDEFVREPEAAGREISCEVSETLPMARIDREALSRAMWNLLENAVKYSDRGQPIRAFVRGSGAKRAGIRGVGIGLALVQRIIEAHGGSVRVESEPGRGSTFTLVIPCLES